MDKWKEESEVISGLRVPVRFPERVPGNEMESCVPVVPVPVPVPPTSPPLGKIGSCNVSIWSRFSRFFFSKKKSRNSIFIPKGHPMDENDAGPAGWFANMNRQASMFEASVIVSAAAAAASAAPAAAATVSDTATAACSVDVSDQTSDVAVDAPAASGGNFVPLG